MNYNEMLEKLGLPANSQPDAVTDLFDGMNAKIMELQGRLHDCETDLMLSRTNEDAAERRLRAVLRCYGEDEVCQRMADDIPTEQIIDMYARARCIE